MARREQLGLICEAGCWDYVRMAPQRLHISRDEKGHYTGFVYCPQCQGGLELDIEELLGEETRDYDE